MFDERLEDFFIDFGIDIQVTLADVTPAEVVTIRGIFEEPSAVQDFGYFNVISTNPSILIEKNVTTARITGEDLVTVGSDRYIVNMPPKDDGTGILRIYLTDAATQDATPDNAPSPPQPRPPGHN